MAHKKGVGSTDNGRDSKSKRLGVKLFGGEHAIPGNIIVRQRGTKYHPGENVGMGKDHTLHALIEGKVTFQKRRNNRTYVHILSNGITKAAATNAQPTTSKATKKVETPKTTTADKKATPKAKDKLTKIEGIGPKVNGLLNDAGILSFTDLANASYEQLKEILAAAGSRYKMMEPATWPQQAQLAADEKWDELKELQDKLDGGRIVDEQE